MINRDAGIRPKPFASWQTTLSQAGLCSRNRQNKVNAMLTIVINLRFTQIRRNVPRLPKRRPRPPLDERRDGNDFRRRGKIVFV
jgi:hypothetical protein